MKQVEKGSKVTKNIQNKQRRSAFLHSRFSLSDSGSVSLEPMSLELTFAGVYSCWRRVYLAFSARRMAAMGKEQLWLSLWNFEERGQRDPCVTTVCFNNVFESGTHPSPDSCHALCWIR